MSRVHGRDAMKPGGPPRPDPLLQWGTFARQVRDRLELGRGVYGDKSFAADPAELLAELQQEALDLAGWAFVLFTRIQQMRAALTESEGEVHAGNGKLLKAREVAERLGISKARVYALARQQKIGGALRIGESVRFDPAQFDKWIRTGGN